MSTRAGSKPQPKARDRGNSIEGQLVTEQSIYIEHHDAETPMRRYHVHPTIEVNFLHGCDMHYSFSGTEVTAPERRLCIFWAAYPHRATGVSGPGSITNIHVVLAEFLRWSLPHKLVGLGHTASVTRTGWRPTHRWDGCHTS